MTRRARIALTLVSLAALSAGTLTSAGQAAADTSPTPIATDGVWGIDYAAGFLSSVERTPSGSQYVIGRQLSADGSTVLERSTRGYADAFADGSHAERVPCDASGGCVPLRSTGAQSVGYFFVDEDGTESAQIWLSKQNYHSADEPQVTGGRFVDATGRYFVYNAASTGKQYVDAVNRYRNEDVRLTRSVTAASVWGSALWTPGSGNGVLTQYDLEGKKTVATVSTGAPCTVKELQVVGRWIYWNCGPAGAAGVYDRTAKKNITVPSGPALVGDGYLVQHDRSAGKLMLTDFHSGTAAAARAIADLPAGNTADQRRLTWSVDKFGGGVAYVDADHTIRIVPSGVPAQSLGKIESDLDNPYFNASGRNGGNMAWMSTWQLNKPADWTFTVKDAQGRTDRTLTGSGTAIDLQWDGTTNSGAYAYNGQKTWTLTAKAADGLGTFTTSGKIALGGGRQGHHDQGGYAYGELATLNSSGTLSLQYTNGGGRFDWKQNGSGWPAGTVAVPFGDMGKDRCAEMLVRMPNGELRRYAGKCGEGSYAPTSSHTSLGTGWNAYNVLTAPGDLTGDGRVDLLARKASTGDVYLFANDGASRLKPGVKIRSWATYKKIVGAGDLNGDGFGDVLVQDKAGTLWRYDGTGTGQVKERVKVFSHWGTSYNVVVGVGDITGDGRNDLVSRDTAGNLYRNNGDGKGSFGGRTKIASGWQGYKGLF
ncbi:FG-GAP-like repeat-containing protein [Streptomyces griseorubiginosus]|uniref:FG-GAP-like repeat-containing protein n=1 Tax=Streptomyces griseorubiginosus TaxID=67304 RepID=UPI0011405292|nr:FG-GAP-like repeat-containing protein [Streptomyces griseorubiginosus]